MASRLLPRLPLSIRVPLGGAALMVLVGLVASQLVLGALSVSQERRLRDLAWLEFETLATSLAPYAVRDDIWAMFGLLDQASRRGEGLRPIRATVVDPLSRVVVSSAPELYPIGAVAGDLLASAVPLAALSYDGGQATVRLRRGLDWRGRALGTLVVEFATDELVAERRTTARLLIAGNIGATALLALAAYLLAARMLRPVRRIAQRMAGSSGLPEPIPATEIPAGDDEVASLARTYNRMVEAVADRKAAERRLAERERFVSLGRLSGTLAHEINNPLGGLLNAVDTLRTYPDRPDAVRTATDLLDRGLSHLRDIVRATLDVHREGRRDQPLTLEDLEDVRLLIQPECDHHGQRLTWSVAPDLDGLAGLPAGPVRQILLNLLLNATNAAGPGGTLGLTVERRGDGTLLAVWDSGPGLPAALRPRLLSDDPVEPGGGMGLRLVRDLVQEMGGSITLDRTPQGHPRIGIALPGATGAGERVR